jgi:hypothetical protein
MSPVDHIISSIFMTTIQSPNPRDFSFIKAAAEIAELIKEKWQI